MTAGTYGGATFGLPWGVGVGLYFDNHGRMYPQWYGGTPRLSLSAGYTPDLEALLTGPSFSGSAGIGSARFNAVGSGGTAGFGIGTPGIGVTHGYGPYELSRDFSRPRVRPYIRESLGLAGISNRNNVFEYGFPEPEPPRSPPGNAFDTGAPPIPFLAPDSPRRLGGLAGIIERSGALASNPGSGGLLELIQEYLRNGRGSEPALAREGGG
jgi:hypothetical protein